ncbi:MAG TPA: M36 family metallopeptidase [Phycisphaerae bacterium]|nr:M36 family metallopeptidase [Phycisphaerae bacterium]
MCRQDAIAGNGVQSARRRARGALWRSALIVLSVGVSVSSAEEPPRPGAQACDPADNRWDSAGRGLPDYDIRRDAPKVPRRIAGRPGALPPHARADRHEFLGTPAYVGSTARFLTGRRNAGAVDAIAIVTDYIAEHRDLFGFDAAELSDTRLSRDFVTRHNGVRHLTFQQRHKGLGVFGAVLRTGVTPWGEIVSIGSTVLDRPADDFAVSDFALSPIEAVRAAASGAGITISVDPQAVERPIQPDDPWRFERPEGFAGEVELRPVYFPLNRTNLRPAWQAVLPVSGAGHVYEVIVDAVDGTLLWRQDRLHSVTNQDASYRVYPSDSPAPGSPGTTTPDGFQFPFDSSVLQAVPAAEIAPLSPSGWIGDGVNETQGNNVDAHTDWDNNDQPDVPRPQGDPWRTFDFPSDHQIHDPPAFPNASVTQLFYLCNVYHDRLYELGFDEAAGNFQLDNFGLGGVGGDRIQADAQDGGGTSSANFSTGAADGSAARLQMYVFTNPDPGRDSAFDADLVFHELTHGLSIRLLGGPAGQQPAALAEGWSDFMAIALNAEPGDDPHGPYPFAAFVAYQRWPEYVDNYYFGLRRFPYCTDLDKCPQTFKDIDPAQQAYPPEVPRNPHVDNTADEPHNAGEIWCAALMECRANLMDRYGFAGNQIMLQLVVDGMKLCVVNPNFLQARDALLQADMVNNGAVNLDILWGAFAKRGMGLGATSPGTGAGGVDEDFNVPDMLLISYPDGRPQMVPPLTDTTFPVQIQGLGAAEPVPGSAQLHYSIDAAPFVSVDLSTTGLGTYEATLPGAPCLSRYEYYLSADEVAFGTVLDPPSAPTFAYEATALVSSTVLFADPMETETGWTVGDIDDDATKGIWERADPEGTLAQPEDDHTPVPGVLCRVTDGRAGSGSGDYDVDDGKTTLTSPRFAVTCGEALVSYWRWFSNDKGPNPAEDKFVVSVSNNDGATWEEVETIGPTGPEAGGGWHYHEFVVSDRVPLSDQLKVRFVAEDRGGGSLVEAAIDDFRVTRFSCSGTSPGDIDDNGHVDLTDFAALYDCLGGPQAPVTATPPRCPEDCLSAFDADEDEDLDLADVATFGILFDSP